jgi:hypothetical protein
MNAIKLRLAAGQAGMGMVFPSEMQSLPGPTPSPSNPPLEGEGLKSVADSIRFA